MIKGFLQPLETEGFRFQTAVLFCERENRDTPRCRA